MADRRGYGGESSVTPGPASRGPRGTAARSIACGRTGDGASLLGTSASRSRRTGAHPAEPALLARFGLSSEGGDANRGRGGGVLPVSVGEAILSRRAAPNWQPTDAPAVADCTSAAPPAPLPETLPSPRLGKCGAPERAFWRVHLPPGSILSTGCGARGLHLAGRSKREAVDEEPEPGTPGREGLAWPPGSSERDSSRPPTARSTQARGFGGGGSEKRWRGASKPAFHSPEVPIPKPREPLAPAPTQAP